MGSFRVTFQTRSRPLTLPLSKKAIFYCNRDLFWELLGGFMECVVILFSKFE